MDDSLTRMGDRQPLIGSPNARWSQVTRVPSAPLDTATGEVAPSRASTLLLTRQPLTLNHHPTHLHLINPYPVAIELRPTVDAIIVPSARPSPYLRNVVRAAKELGCRVLVLCSVRASARGAVRIADEVGVEMIAIDVDGYVSSPIPNLVTSDLVRDARFCRFAHRKDTAFKRNLGLVIARMAGWERVTLLDDDLLVSSEDLNYSAQLLDSYACVGFASEGFPDNSIVCHAYRDAGGQQDSFIGAGALTLSMTEVRSFFPNIYNEDWFFLLDQDELYPAAMTGQVYRTPYDPYRGTVRARLEEFGENLAEGIFWLLDEGETSRAAGYGFWNQFLETRRRFIDEVLDMVYCAPIERATRGRMIEVLKASRGRSWVIDPQLCVDYLDAWRWDRGRWRAFLDNLPVRWTPADIVARLDLAGATQFSRCVDPYQRLWFDR